MADEKNGPAYAIGVQQSFSARHYLIGGDWGEENRPHDHRYRIEVRLHGDKLNEHGYLVDIDHVMQQLAAEIRQYAQRVLNDLPPFAGLNPSLEHFARILGEGISGRLQAPEVTSICVRLWESDDAWAQYRSER